MASSEFVFVLSLFLSFFYPCFVFVLSLFLSLFNPCFVFVFIFVWQCVMSLACYSSGSAWDYGPICIINKSSPHGNHQSSVQEGKKCASWQGFDTEFLNVPFINCPDTAKEYFFLSATTLLLLSVLPRIVCYSPLDKCLRQPSLSGR